MISIFLHGKKFTLPYTAPEMYGIVEVINYGWFYHSGDDELMS